MKWVKYGFLTLLTCVFAVWVAGFLNFLHPLFDSISHFRFQVFIVLLILLNLQLALNRKWILLSICAVLSIGYYHIRITSGPDISERPDIKVVQFNTYFRNQHPEKAIAWISRQAPDFVTMQELSRRTMGIYDQLGKILPYGTTCRFAGVGAVGIRSRFPLKDISCVEGRGLVWAQADINGQLITIGSLHLYWPYPFGQWRQLKRLENSFKQMKEPVIIGGDFNAAPWSAAVKKVFSDTNTRLVGGLRLSLKLGPFKSGPFSGLPIDHVLVPRGAFQYAARLGPLVGSDHRPVFIGIRCGSDLKHCRN